MQGEDTSMLETQEVFGIAILELQLLREKQVVCQVPTHIISLNPLCSSET
jgi:hypothetical protein